MAAAVEQQHARAIVDAAERGDLDEVQRLVEQNRMLLNAESDSMSSPLVAAANMGRLEVVRYLLDEGADIDLWTVRYGTALEAACFSGRLAVAALLLANGADTAPDHHGWTRLMVASRRGHTDMVELLLAHGGGQHIDYQPPNFGSTALHYACISGRAGMVRLLLGAGADPHVENHCGDTPLSRAIRQGHAECIAMLQVSSVLVCQPESNDRPSISLRSRAPNAALPSLHRTGSACTSSPRPAASAMPLPR
jgi:ankyrin repeat protein